MNSSSPDNKKPQAGDVPPRRLAYPINEGCQLGGFSRSHLYALAAAGKVRLIKVGNRRLLPASELERLTSEGT